MISGVLALAFTGPVAAQDFLATGIQAERQGDLTAAEAAYEQGVHAAKEQGLTRQEAAARHRLAVLKAKQGKIRESEDFFRQAVHLDSGNVAMLCDFAKLYSDRKKYADAETILKNAALTAPDNRRVLYNLGYAIASQKNRQTEGLRYLKLALGESRAYRELAKICEAAGNREQAEYAQRRAAVLEQTEPEMSPEALNSPTVPMDDTTRKEIVDRIREELLRQEAVEIAEEMQNEPSEPPKTIEKPQDPFFAAAGAMKPVPVAAEKSTADVQEEPKNESDALPTLPRIVPPTLPTAKEPEKKPMKELANVGDLPAPAAKEPTKMAVRPVPVEQRPKPSDAEPLRAVPSLTGSKKTTETRSLPSEKIRPETTSRIRGLPEPEHRISNSQDALTSTDSANEISPLPILVLPLDDKPAQGSLPEYTAIGIKRIPSKKKESQENAPQFAASERRTPQHGNDPMISLSINKSTIAGSTVESPTVESQPDANQDAVSPHPPQLAQPVSLITMESRYPASRQNTAGTRQNNTLRRLTLTEAGSENPKDEQAKTVDKKPISEATAEKSILQPGAGKNWNREVNEEYVYVNPDKPVEEENRQERVEKQPLPPVAPPRPHAIVENKTTVRLIAPERPLPENREDVARSQFRRTPEPVVEPVAVHDKLESSEEERSEVQFSSNRAPNVLKFELSRGEQHDPFLAMSEPVKKTEDRFEPPTVLKFSPSGESTLAVRKLEEEQVEEPMIALQTPEKPITPPLEVVLLPSNPIREERIVPQPATQPATQPVVPVVAEPLAVEAAPVVSEELVARTEPVEKRNSVRFVPVPKPQPPTPEPIVEPIVMPEPTREMIAKTETMPKTMPEVRNPTPTPPRNPPETFDVVTLGENPMRMQNIPAPVEVKESERPAPLDLSRLARIVESSEPPVQEKIAVVQPTKPPVAEPVVAPPIEPPSVAMVPEPVVPEPNVQVAATPVQAPPRVRAPVNDRVHEKAKPERQTHTRRRQTVEEDNDLAGFATSRKAVPAAKVAAERPKMEDDVNEMLTPRNSLSGLSALTEKTEESKAGFARSGKYSTGANANK